MTAGAHVFPHIHRVLTAVDIATVAQLAHRIWHEHYPGIISLQQIDFMLARFQSEAAIAAQLAEGHEYALIVMPDMAGVAQDVGYLAWQAQPDIGRLFLSKLYVVQALQQQGLGHFALDYLKTLGQHRQLDTLWLRVNKHNPALQAYLRWGFRQVAEVVTEVGAGFVMDDFQLELDMKETR